MLVAEILTTETAAITANFTAELVDQFQAK
jgi:hypothetical protein